MALATFSTGREIQPGLTEAAVTLAGPVRLSDFAAQYLSGGCGYALLVDGEPVRPASFASVTVFPAADLRVLFRAEGQRDVAQIAIIAASAAALAVGVPAPLVALGAAAANFALAALMPPPTVPVPQRKPDDSENSAPTLSSAQNTGRLGDAIPEIIGQRRRAPDLVGAGWTEHVAGDIARLNLQMAIGMGEYDLHEVRLGNTVVWKDGSATSAAVVIEHLDPGDVSTLMPDRVIPASPGRSALKWVDASTFTGPFVIGAPGVRVDKIAINVEFPAGLGNFSGGGRTDHSVDFRFEYRVIDDDGVAVSPWLCLAEHTETAVTTSPVRFTVSQTVAPRRYEVRGQVSASQPTDPAIVNGAVWDSLYGFVVDGAGTPDYSRLNVRVENIEEFDTGQAGQTTVLVTRKLPSWSTGGGWAAAAATRTRAAGVSHILRSANLGNLADAEFDLAWLWATQTDWDSEGDTLDLIIDARADLISLVRGALAVGLADVTPQGGALGFFRDVPRTGVPQFFGSASIARGSVEETGRLAVRDDPSHVEVEYIDAGQDWQRETVACAVGGVTFGENPRRVRAEGCTDRTLAWRYGMHLAAIDRYRRLSGKFGAELQGRLVFRGDALRLAHPLVSPQSPDGVVLDWNAGTRTFTLSEDYGWPAGNNYIVLRDRQGREWGDLLVTEGAAANIAIADSGALTALETASSQTVAAVLPNDGQLGPYALGPSAEIGADVLVSRVTPQGADGYTVDFVTDDPRVYSITSGKTPPPRQVLAPLPGTPAAAPDVAGLNLSIPGDGELAVEVQMPAGATKFEIKMTGVAGVESTEPRRLFTSVSAGTYIVEARAFGSAWGNWYAQTVKLSGTAQAPAALANLDNVGAPDATQPSVAWDDAADATLYRVRLLWGALEKFREEEAVDNAYSWTSGEMAALDADYGGIVVEVTPRNIHGNGTEATLQIGQPAALSNPSAFPASISQIDVGADPAAEESSVGGVAAVEYVVAWSSSSGFDPDAAPQVVAPAPLLAVTGLAENTSYFFRVAGYVNSPSAAPLNWSAQTGADTPASP